MIKYNVGCGKRNFGPKWVHVDGGKYPHVTNDDICLGDVEDNLIDLLYSSHLIAYFNRWEMRYILKFWYVKIKPGGILRLATPDFNILSKMHQVGIDLDKLLGPLYGKMEMDKQEIYHKTVYDEASLTKLLEEAGFVNVRRYSHANTEHPNTGNREDFYDDHSSAYINGTLISLNMEACKP